MNELNEWMNEQISQNPRRVMHILVLGPGLEQL